VWAGILAETDWVPPLLGGIAGAVVRS
jgi:hypothetical protein